MAIRVHGGTVRIACADVMSGQVGVIRHGSTDTQQRPFMCLIRELDADGGVDEIHTAINELRSQTAQKE